MAALLAVWGCSSPNAEAPPFSPATGHPEGWMASHGVSYASNSASCQECHGADLQGGISGVSCYMGSRGGASCHATGPAGHPAGWGAVAQHGASAKASGGGFESCIICHGADFSGGATGPSCYTCHGVSAPHPSAPWRGGAVTHTTTDQANASACDACHRSPSAPSGTPAGCFNSTLCHGSIGGGGGGTHVAGWSAASQHGVTAESNFSACRTCHGSDYRGGSTAVTCYDCHSGPGITHPAAGWVVSDHRNTATAQGSASCQKCHGANYSGGGSGVACSTCHMENQTKVHMTAWYPDVQLNHRTYAKNNGTARCATVYCHGTNLSGVAQSGPSCSSCHTWPFTQVSCTSCHGNPPDGSASPNRAGKHSVHLALSGTNCSSCHSGAGSGTALHQNSAVDVVMAATFNAKTGAASSSGGTCAKVSCHGGATTPAWLTGAIDVNTQCATCHTAGTTQYNSQYSGKHGTHANKSVACTSCHDTARLATYHFNDLATTAMTEAAQTLKTTIGYSGGSCATPGCHGAKGW